MPKPPMEEMESTEAESPETQWDATTAEVEDGASMMDEMLNDMTREELVELQAKVAQKLKVEAAPPTYSDFESKINREEV